MENKKPTGLTSALNQIEFAGGKFQDFDVLNYATNTNKKQCDLCNPRPETKRRAAKFCADCTAKGERLETDLFEHFRQNRKIIRLHRCIGCNNCIPTAKFSIYYGICKNCLGNKDGSKAARSKFVSRAANNFIKIMRGAMCL